MAVGLGLLAALLWGLSDFLISVSGRSFGIRFALLFTQITGVVLVGSWIVIGSRSFPDASATVWLFAGSAAALGLVSTLALYRSLQVGVVSIAAPVAASFGAVTTLFSVLDGVTLGGSVLAGLCLVLAGVLLAGIRPGSSVANSRAGVLLACLAAFGFGLQFWLQGRFVVPQLGSVWPVWITYLFSTTLLTAIALIRREPVRLNWRASLTTFATGAAGVGGFLSLSAGLATGELAVVTVLSSLQSVVTVGMAVVFYGEKPVARQWVGLAMLLAGLVLTRLA